eukprot:1727671-Rhodomonas_salina.2
MRAPHPCKHLDTATRAESSHQHNKKEGVDLLNVAAGVGHALLERLQLAPARGPLSGCRCPTNNPVRHENESRANRKQIENKSGATNGSEMSRMHDKRREAALLGKGRRGRNGQKYGAAPLSAHRQAKKGKTTKR